MKNKFFFLVLFLAVNVCTSIYSKEKTGIDSNKVSNVYYEVLNNKNEPLRIEVLENNKIFNIFTISDLINIISNILLLSSLIFAYSSIRSNIKNNNKQIQNYNTFELYKSLLEINKLSMQYPELWGYLDDYKHLILNDKNEINYEKDARVTEFINYHISLFNRAHGFYVVDKNKNISDYYKNIWSSWVNYIKTTINQSSRMKEYIMSSEFEKFYDKDFVDFIRSLK